MGRNLFGIISAVIFFAGCAAPGPLAPRMQATVFNDVHSRLNPTEVAEVYYPHSTREVAEIIKQAKKNKQAVSISCGRHAMGGQQFGAGTVHISMTEMNRILSFDKRKGLIRVEAGIEWPELLSYLGKAQEGRKSSWSIIQKQTGAERLTLGGALSANAHGCGLQFKPIIQDVDAFTLVNADGRVLKVSRRENAELFKLAIGGYGLFGVITSVDLRLGHRQKLQRVVESVRLENFTEKIKQKINEGYLYGDCQFKTDPTSEDFMQLGILSVFKPVSDDTLIPDNQKQLTPDQWYYLIHLAHVDKSKAFELYTRHYLNTNGQIYWSDAAQTGLYADQYIEYLEKTAPELPKGSLMLTEVYVPRDRLSKFMQKVIQDAHKDNMNIIYDTVRFIKRDDESFLAWAKQDYACVIFNLRVEHSETGIAQAQEDFQRLIDRALELDGSYYLTYHRWARRDQVLAAYPQFPEFLKLKLKYDPEERFQSDWYRFYKKMFAEELKLGN